MSKVEPTQEPQTRELSYSAASRELDAILDAIEAGATDVDALSEKVERAAVLIKVCRDKLAGTELRVRKVVDELNAALGTAADPSGDD
jgi:exodeoxyribonuclease VII small subunit